MREKAAMLIAALLCAIAAPARAQDCASLHYVTGVSMTPAGGNVMTVPVTIDGVPKAMMLDTGGAVSELTRTALGEFNLPERVSPIKTYDVSGRLSRTLTQVHSLELGSVDFTNLALQIDADPDVGAPFSGLISDDLLSAYDVDIDFGSNRLNFFSADHCAAGGVYWPTRPLAVVPFHISDSHIVLPIVLDGYHMSAIIDTGSSFTTLNSDIARYFFGLKPGSVGMKKFDLGPGDAAQQADYSHVFSNLSFTGVTVSNPFMIIVPGRALLDELDPQWGHLPRRVSPPDVTIGMDILKTLHIYVAYKEHKLYITRADKAAAAALPPLGTSPADSHL